MNKITFFSTLFALTSASFSAQAYEDITPAEAYNMAMNYPDVYIVDVRTDAEWQWVGHPGANLLNEGEGLDDKVANVSFKIYKKNNFITNPSFLSDMNDIFPDKANVKLITMCRSGVRSEAAASALEGADYANVFNMVTGFEGGKDYYGYRTLNGWKVDGLPYVASGSGKYDD